MEYAELTAGTYDDLEKEVLEQWGKEDLFHQTVAATKGLPPFVFYEGPPTANGKPGIHHVFARTIKDLICRFQTMQGREVTRIAGWDTHGLPVEIEVEKALKISGKADIEKFGVAEFNRRCKESVFRYKSDWEALSDRIGYWLDYDRPYVTYENSYVESAWSLLKKLWEGDNLYEGHKVLPYCIRCGTSLSSHELSMGYDTHKSPSIYALFRLVEDDGEPARNLLVWTTTPWTLPSNVAVAVNPAFEYVELDVGGTRLIVEKTIAQNKVVPGATGGEALGTFPVVATYKGSDLVGKRYVQLADAVEVDPERAFRVVAGEFVTQEEGTGIVHMAPAFGADDYDTVTKEGMAFVNPVDSQGRFFDTAWSEINGLTVFEANSVIADRLKKENLLFGRYDEAGYEHTYPFCWRCDSPLIYYARRSWFVRTTAFRDRMVALNETVNWHPPEVGSGRFGEWLENNVDWALSRDRFWGTPLPAWVCDKDRSHQVVIGSFEELAERTGETLTDDFDPHKPGIDAFKFACDRCDGAMVRVPEVIDAWFDSGAMPYAQWHYPFENGDDFKNHFPADFICEGLDQTRGWFYSLLAIAAGTHDSLAYRNVIVNGLVLDADGRKMSKRIGNVVNPWEAVEEFGADAVRLYLLASSQVWLPKRFDVKAIPDVALGFLNRLRNTYTFFASYAAGTDEAAALPIAQRPVVDRWLLSRLAGVLKQVAEAWSSFDVTAGTRALIDFCDNDLSQWYVRINRPRFWAPDRTADPSAVDTLKRTLVAVSRALAPAAPFISDALHRRLIGRSVHLERFPVQDMEADAELDDAMTAVRRLASAARAAREEKKINVRQPLATMRIALPVAIHGDALEQCLPLLQKEVNVKRIEIVSSDEELVTLKGKANFRALGKLYGKDTPNAAKAASDLEPGALQKIEEGESVTVKVGKSEYVFDSENVSVQREVKSDWAVRSDGPFVVALDEKLTDDLKREGMARELVNRIQRLRKEAGYDFKTRIELGVAGETEILAATESHGTFIAAETLSRRFISGEELQQPDLRRELELDGHAAVITLRQFSEENGA
ncbi:MAG: isoleucine--tRNA ligase [Gemmatimonadota bacterium]|nr:isoleucine--tRNA ligase [Gemmatimonadota bacterium]